MYSKRVAGAVMFAALMRVVATRAAEHSTPVVSQGILHFANNIVVDSVKDSARNRDSGATLSEENVVADEIAFFSSKAVTVQGRELVIRNSKRGAVAVRVHDASGREVFSYHSGTGRTMVTIGLNEIPRGLYVCSVRIADSVFVRTFFVTR